MPPRIVASPTAQQTAALTASGSVVLSSGAGCGKTFVLTRRYLGYLAEHAVGEIVAITFTDRAAREMRQRIRTAIREKAAEEPGGGWDAHLRDLDSATITTIHSFCGNLVRQHSILLGVDPRFEILEEMLKVNLMDDAVRRSLQGLLTAKNEVGEDCRRLTVMFGWADLLRSIGDLVVKRDVPAWERWVARPAAEIAAEWMSVYGEMVTTAAHDLFARHPATKRALELLRTHTATNPKVRARLTELQEQLSATCWSNYSATDYRRIRESTMIHKERHAAWQSKEVYDAMLDGLKRFRDELDDSLKKFADTAVEDVEEIAEVGKAFVRVALRVSDEFHETKRRAGVLDFEDLLTLAHQLLSEHKGVLRQVRQRYRRLLLDEMQDTDPVQMAIVRLLTDDPLTDRRLFAVGDVKQSIYRFRGADVSLFGTLQESVPVANRLPLTTNFRSQPPVLTFVNALFSPVFTGYEPLTTLAKPLHRDPCVEFWWSVFGENGAKADDLRAMEAKTVAKRLRRWIDDRQPLVAEKGGNTLRPMAPGDVVLLFRSMTNVPIYEAALRAEGLNYYIVGGRAFFAQQEVYDVLNLLKTLENPDDAVSLLGTLRSPLGALSDETLLALGQHAGGLWEGLRAPELPGELLAEQRARVLRAAAWITAWRALKDRVPMTILLRRVLEVTGYDGTLQFETLGERKLANMWKLTELARRFDQTSLFHLSDFIKQLSAMVSRELREEQAATEPENADVVRLMSIHQSKGLEFPVVVLPDVTGKKSAGFRGRVRWDRDLGCVVKSPDEKPPLFGDFAHDLANVKEAASEFEEEQRIFYVATTRAKDLLVLSGSFAEPFPTDGPADLPLEIQTPNPWLKTLNGRFHLDTGKCFDATLTGDDSPNVGVHIETASDESPRSERTKTLATKARDGRPSDPTRHFPRAVDLDDILFDTGPEDRDRLVEVLAALRAPKNKTETAAKKNVSAAVTSVVRYQPTAVSCRHATPPHWIDIRGTTDGHWDGGVVVIDNRHRGEIRLGLAAKSSQGGKLSLVLVDSENGDVSTISEPEAETVLSDWLASSLKINADAE